MAAHDAHVRAFVERWAPDEAMQIEQDRRTWAAGLAACWRMTASEPAVWMSAICVWSLGSVPVLTGAAARLKYFLSSRAWKTSTSACLASLCSDGPPGLVARCFHSVLRQMYSVQNSLGEAELALPCLPYG